MPEYIYFLTIDRVKLGKPPSKRDIFEIRNSICRDAELKPLTPYPVHCFEWKNKGTKNGRYLHYHTLLSSIKSFIPYKLIKRSGWSLKLEKMKSYMDVARTAGYINKLKKDYCDLDKLVNLYKLDV